MGAVRKGLSMGAHRGVLVTDPALRGADTLATARVLAAAISREPFDLVLTGSESTDGYTGTLPMTVAGLLGIPSLTFARKLELVEGTVRIERQTDLGYDVLESELPALVSVTGGGRRPPVRDAEGHHVLESKPVEPAHARRPRALGDGGGAVPAGPRRDPASAAPARSSRATALWPASRTSWPRRR